VLSPAEPDTQLPEPCEVAVLAAANDAAADFKPDEHLTSMRRRMTAVLAAILFGAGLLAWRLFG
jgi:hypothetical protein